MMEGGGEGAHRGSDFRKSSNGIRVAMLFGAVGEDIFFPQKNKSPNTFYSQNKSEEAALPQ